MRFRRQRRGRRFVWVKGPYVVRRVGWSWEFQATRVGEPGTARFLGTGTRAECFGLCETDGGRKGERDIV